MARTCEGTTRPDQNEGAGAHEVRGRGPFLVLGGEHVPQELVAVLGVGIDQEVLQINGGDGLDMLFIGVETAQTRW